MPRAVWTGSLSFGLVTIPVALYPATSPKDVRFHLFDREGRRVRYRRFAEAMPNDEEPSGEAADAGPESTGDIGGEPEAEVVSPPDRELGYQDLVRGYEVEPGRFALLEHEELERARPARSATIDLEDFVELDEIDPVFFEKTYYLAPRRDADGPYALLLETLRRTGLVGIGRFVLRTKPHLVAIRAAAGVIALQILYFGDEVRAPSEVVPSVLDTDTSERELRVAEQLVQVLATSWEPSRYADAYREELLRIISEKEPVGSPEAAGQEPTPTARVGDLMDALKRSVEEAKAKQRDSRRAG